MDESDELSDEEDDSWLKDEQSMFNLNNNSTSINWIITIYLYFVPILQVIDVQILD